MMDSCVTSLSGRKQLQALKSKLTAGRNASIALRRGLLVAEFFVFIIVF